MPDLSGKRKASANPKPELVWPHCAGQPHVKETLAAAVSGGRLGHAYLFSGMEGSGKFAAALDLALMLLCEDDGKKPCLRCPSCTTALHYSNPDFHVVMPVDLPKQFKGDDDGGDDDGGGDEGPKKSEKEEKKWEFISDRITERITDPYLQPAFEKKPDIPVAWIRELAHAVLRGTVGAGVNVGIFDGVDLMKPATANSMLKFLEEPPPGTVLLLLTDRISNVLPTIVSRCQVLRFSHLPPADIRAEMVRRLSLDPADPRLESVADTGSLGQSIVLWNRRRDEAQQAALELWDLCAGRRWSGLGPFVDRVGEWKDYSLYEELFGELLLRIRNSFFSELGCSENVFSGGRSRVVAWTAGRTLERCERLLAVCQRGIDAVRTHANSTLLLAHAALALTEALHEQKQQTR